MEFKNIMTIYILASIAFVVLYFWLDSKYGSGKGGVVVKKADLDLYKNEKEVKNDTN